MLYGGKTWGEKMSEEKFTKRAQKSEIGKQIAKGGEEDGVSEEVEYAEKKNITISRYISITFKYHPVLYLEKRTNLPLE